MPSFKIFPGTNADLLAAQVNQLIGTVLGTQEEVENYFDQFNSAVNKLNQLLLHPPSQNELDKKVEELKKEYNQALSLEQHRWMQGDGEANFYTGKQVVKHLAQRKGKYNESLVLQKSFERRTLDINLYLSKSGWVQIFKEAKKVDCLQEVERLQLDWSAQKQLAHCDCQDLSLILSKIKDFQWFLNLIRSVPIENLVIINILNDNETILKKVNKHITVAIGWRLHAASLRGNLWCDDHLWALRFSLEQLLGLDFQADSKVVSQKLTPSIAKVFIKHLQKAQHKIDRDKWFSSKWIVDPDNHYPIKVTLTPDLEMLPTVLMPFIPTLRNGFSEIFPDYFIRYFYFRGSNPKYPLEKCIKKNLIGEPYELIAFLNEATHQVNVLQDSVSEQDTLTLCDLIQTPGFKSALLFPEVLLQERNRISKFQSTAWVMKGFNWCKQKLLANKTQDFFLQWSEILSVIEENIVLKSKKILSKIIVNLEHSLVQEIKDNIFSCPKSLLTDLSKFVQYYGNHDKKARFEKITSPAYLFKKFQFFMLLESELDFAHQIDKEMVFVFLRYANLYWSSSECAAAQAIAQILNGKFPKNEEEDAQLLGYLSAWFKKGHKKRVVHFLNMLGLNFVVKTASRSDPFAYRFLEQYTLEGFKIWEKEREKDLSQKYFSLIGMFSKPLGCELDIEAQRAQKIEIAFIDDLKRDQSQTDYIGALKRVLKEYLKSYDGSNGHYAEFVLHLCDPTNVPNNFEPYLHQYFTLRLTYLVKEPTSPELTSQELSTYCQLSSYPMINTILGQVLLEQDQVKLMNVNIYSILSVLKSFEILGNFYFKRMSTLVRAGWFDTVYFESDYFDKDKNNVVFKAKISKFFIEHLKSEYAQSAQLLDPKLHWILECYGDQQVKEEARYIKIKQFLQYDKKKEVDHFLNELKDYIEAEDLAELFKLKGAKKRLANLYNDYNTAMLEQRFWDGYAQYLMESISYPQTQTCIIGAHIAWLNALLFNLHPFFDDINKYLGEHPVIDVHMKNIQVPNDEINLTTFFGSGFFQVKNIIIQYLSQFEMCPNDRKLKLITRYLDDEIFRREEDWNILHDRLLVYKTVHEIMHYFINNEWGKAKQNLISLQDRQRGYRLLLANSPDKESLQIQIQYYNTMLTALQKTALLYCKAADLKSNEILKLFQGPLVKTIFLTPPPNIQRRFTR